MEHYHTPVLLDESLDFLEIDPQGVYVDATFGGGGHSRAILDRLSTGRLIAFDQDPDAKANLPEDERLIFIPTNFQFLEKALTSRNLRPVQGILADLGVSSHQLDTPSRGFSHRFTGPLDMRMDRSREFSAVEVLETYSAAQLLQVFRSYGEIPNAHKLVHTLLAEREREKITTTTQLEQAISSCIPPQRKAKYLSQVYQALRIAVNQELEVLEDFLQASLQVLATGGRLVVISYHSLEDRMVKHFFRSGNFQDQLAKDFYGNPITPWELITRRAVKPQDKEIALNPRARSARLRVAQKK